MPEPTWLTMEEACFKFKVGSVSIKSMIKNGVLQSLRVGTQAGVGQYRILDVTPEFAQRQAEAEEHIVHVPLLSTAEVAEVTGHTVLYIQQLVKQRRLKPINPGKFSSFATGTKLFTVAEVRRFLFKKEKRKRKGRRVVKIDRVVVWAKTLIDEERRKSVEGLVVKDELLQLIESIMELPAAERMTSLRMLWHQLDLVNVMQIAASIQPLTDEPRPQEYPVPRESASGTGRSSDTTGALSL